MASRGLSILDALENLNTLADADSLDEIEVTEDAHLISRKGEEEREVYWLKAGADDLTLTAIKTTFRTVHDYLQSFYTKMKKSGGDTKRLIEGVNTIMVLVGEAAKKVDRLGALFRERVSDFKEYKELQHFYRNKVIKESFQAFAKVPIPKEKREKKQLKDEESWSQEVHEILSEKEEVEEVLGIHLLNDIKAIKKDHLYELFYLKNEAGHRFYTYDLARNLKLACDFGEFADEYFGDDPLLQIKNWEDKSLNLLAIKILKSSRSQLDKFYKEAMRYKEMELIASLHKACMSLMLAANPRNLIRQFSPKGCYVYFADFLTFLRETLSNREYQKFQIYAPPENKPFFHNVLNLIEQLCYALFTQGPDQEEVQASIKKLIEREGFKKSHTLGESIGYANLALIEALQKHPSGPVFKALDLVRDEDPKVFDPIFQGNFPELACTVKNEKEIKIIRMPCPITQEWISQAQVLEEFKTFLRKCDAVDHLLFVNYQDRTSWKEHARVFALEELSKQAEFVEALTVVTLPKNTDFYNQVGVYENLNDAQEFLAHFSHHLEDENTGFYFPSDLKRALFPDFMKGLLTQIHETFFKSKKSLSFLERLDFIQLAYHFITLKIMEIVNPTYLTLSSKDGLDSGSTALIGFIALLTPGKKWKGEELDKLNALLFGPTLLNRERTPHIEEMDRLEALIRLLEKSNNFLKPFTSLYEKSILNREIKI